MKLFCEANYPSLYMSYDGQPKGSSSSWIYFRTSVEKMWVVYKSSPGEIVLEYHGANPNFSKENLKPYMERGMSFCPLGKSFGVMVQKSRWKISFREDFENVLDVMFEVLEQVQRLVELANKIENF